MKWLIDGHNLIGRMPNIRLDDPYDEEKLLGYLRSFRARTGHSLTVVFDAGPSYQTGSNQKRGGITVQFAPSGQIADQILVQRIRKIKNPQEVMVVTSDQAVAQIARQAGIRVTPSGEFARQLLQMQTNPGEEDDQTNVSLTANEVDEWLNIFNQQNE